MHPRTLAAAPMGFVALVRGTTLTAWRHRVHGLAAEVGFWAMLSLPPLLLGMLGLVGYVAPLLGSNVVPALQDRIVAGVGQFLVPEVVDNVVRPLVEGALFRGRAAVASVGFAVAFWTGSTALGAFLNAIAIAYDRQGVRGIVRTRVLAIGVYVLALVAGVVFLPLLVVGPRLLAEWLPVEIRGVLGSVVQIGYWPIVAAIAVLVVLVLYRIGMPGRVRWRAHAPGAVFAVAVWLGASIVLRAILRFVFANLYTYGPLATPIASLLFFYISALVVLVGAELNAQYQRQHRR